MIAQTGFLFSIFASRHKVISENHSARYFKLQPWCIKIFYRKFLISIFFFFFVSGTAFLRRPLKFDKSLSLFFKFIIIYFKAKKLEDFFKCLFIDFLETWNLFYKLCENCIDWNSTKLIFAITNFFILCIIFNH